MTQVQTKSYFFIYTIKLWNAWPQDAAVAKSTWGLKSKSEEFAEEKSADGYQIEKHCCWFSEQMDCKLLGEGPERLLWGCVIYVFALFFPTDACCCPMSGRRYCTRWTTGLTLYSPYYVFNIPTKFLCLKMRKDHSKQNHMLFHLVDVIT